MKKVFTALGKCLEAFCMFNLVAIVILFTYSIIMRYIFHSGSAVVDELIKYMFVWFIYLSMALATKEKRHVAVNAFTDLFKGKAHSVIALISNAGWLYFNGFIAFSAMILIQSMIKLGAKTPALGITQAYL